MGSMLGSLRYCSGTGLNRSAVRLVGVGAIADGSGE